ncbi:MAG: phosphatase PAP2 family protein [Flavobacteriales bacterium]|nr:phosphatase PAP2 family protein [Flavobacteriales bacterium]
MQHIAARTWPGATLRAICILAVTGAHLLNAQTQHSLLLPREAAITATGFALIGTGTWRSKMNSHNAPAVIDLANVPLLDRVATKHWSLSAHRTSNALFGVTAAAALCVAIANQQGEQPLLPVAIMAESSLLCMGLTNTVKELARRPRPYLYNPDVPASIRRPREDELSFWSGHTANTAAITFSCASLVQRSDASPDLKTATWLGAAVAPAAMGYLRVRAGRHFPTDVLTGYAVGALLGIVVPYFHRSGNGALGN